MELPKKQRSEFMYSMRLLIDCMEEHLLEGIPQGLFKQLDTHEISSLLATLIVNKH